MRKENEALASSVALEGCLIEARSRGRLSESDFSGRARGSASIHLGSQPMPIKCNRHLGIHAKFALSAYSLLVRRILTVTESHAVGNASHVS